MSSSVDLVLFPSLNLSELESELALRQQSSGSLGSAWVCFDLAAISRLLGQPVPRYINITGEVI